MFPFSINSDPHAGLDLIDLENCVLAPPNLVTGLDISPKSHKIRGKCRPDISCVIVEEHVRVILHNSRLFVGGEGHRKNLGVGGAGQAAEVRVLPRPRREARILELGRYLPTWRCPALTRYMKVLRISSSGVHEESAGRSWFGAMLLTRVCHRKIPGSAAQDAGSG